MEATEEKSNFNLSDRLSVGTWVLMPYGYDLHKFCVLERAGDKVLIGKPNWLVSSAIWFSIEYLEVQGGTILGDGKRRWWRVFLPFINELIFPYGRYK